MSVLIKDLEMPKTCNICPCFERDWQDDDIVGYCKAKKTKLQKYKIPFDCPLVEVPPTIQLELHWVSCSERLPGVKQKVLVQYADGSMMTKRCNDAGHLPWFYANAVAWMPAPKPWEGDAE